MRLPALREWKNSRAARVLPRAAHHRTVAAVIWITTAKNSKCWNASSAPSTSPRRRNTARILDENPLVLKIAAGTFRRITRFVMRLRARQRG
jgi:hypothetical protein